MAVACWLLGGRNLRSRRNNHSRGSNGDFVQMDYFKDPSENMYEILANLTKRDGISEGRRLSYLNAFISLVTKSDVNYSDFGYSAEEILYCLRPLAFDESNQLKNASFRAVRLFIKTPEHVDLFIKLKYDFLVSRQITAAGIQLCRRVLVIAPEKFTYAPLQAIIALSQPSHSDNLHAAALAFLAEIAILNPDVFIACGGVNSIIRNLPYLKPRMTEALLAPLLYLMNKPETRLKAGINLHCLTEPIDLDKNVNINAASGAGGGASPNSAGSELSLSTSALLCLLRSWPGLLHMAAGKPTPAIAYIVNTLYIPNLQRTMVTCLYELFGLSTPDWTDEMRVALDGVDPSRWQSAFSLAEGFIASEVLSIRSHLATSRVDLVEVHLALVLRTLLEAHLLDAIVHIIVSNDTFLSVYATILLGELLGLVHKWLPVKVTRLLPGLPNLISYAIRGRPISTRTESSEECSIPVYFFNCEMNDSVADDNSEIDVWEVGRSGGSWPMATLVDLYSRRFSIDSQDRLSTECQEKQSRAQISVTALDYMDMIKRRPPTPSLYLAQLMPKSSQGRHSQGSHHHGASSNQSQLMGSMEESIKESGVLSHQDPTTWNWDTIQAVLKTGGENLRKSTDSNKRTFLRRLVSFYIPKAGRFSHIPLSADNKAASKLSLVAIDLINLLVPASPDSESGKLVIELLSAIKSCLVEILSSKSAHDCFISPHSCSNTHSRDYFLIIGQFCKTSKGRQALTSVSMYSVLTDLIQSTNHDCYIKLIISTLDYANDDSARKILSVALESKSISGRMYSTRILHSLLRLGISGSLLSFIIYSIVVQLEDEDRSIASYAVNVLHEACDRKEYLECLVDVTPSLGRLGDHGYLLLARCLSTTKGFKELSQANFVPNQLNKWYNHFNFRYVNLVESSVTEAMTNMSCGVVVSRWSQDTVGSTSPREAFLYPHLYQCLSQHKDGRAIVLAHHSIPLLVQVVKEGKCVSDMEILSLKAALYALSGIAIHLDLSVIFDMVKLATECEVYSIRSVAYTCLSNVATTQRGVQLLSNLGWHSVRHNRDDRWPLVDSVATTPSSPERVSAVRELRQSTSTASVSSDHGNKSMSDRLLEETVVEEEEESAANDSFWDTSGAMRDKRSSTLPSSSFANRSILSDSVVSPMSELRVDWSGRYMRSNSCTDPSGTARLFHSRLRHHSFSITERRPPCGLSPIASLSSISRGTGSSALLPSLNMMHSGVLKRSEESVLKTLPQPVPYPTGLTTYGNLKRMNSAASNRIDPSSITMDPEDADFSTGDDNSLDSVSDRTTNSPKSSIHGEISDIMSCYMGITMPDRLNDLFPPLNRHAMNNHVAFMSHHLHDKGLEDLKNPMFHREICFLGNRGVHNTMVSCSESDDHCLIDGEEIDFDKETLEEGESNESSINDVSNLVEHPFPLIFKSRPIIRSEITHMVQQLSNPLMQKMCRQSLLQIKQADKELMEDACVLSDVLYILSRCHIRLASREFLHELFDSTYPQIWSDAASYLADVTQKRGIVTGPITANRSTSRLSDRSKKKSSDRGESVPIDSPKESRGDEVDASNAFEDF